MEKIMLNGEWDLYYFPQNLHADVNPQDLYDMGLKPLKAEVPGNVELELIKAGALPEDLLTGDRILTLKPYELYEWWYERDFHVPEDAGGREMELVFHGVDCIAEYWLNGQSIGQSCNMFIEHRFNIAGLAAPGRNNRISVRLKSAILEASGKEYTPAMDTLPTIWPQLWIRKAPHSYGWDIMPRAVSAGLWRGVELAIYDVHEIADICFFTESINKDSVSSTVAEIGVIYQLKLDFHRLDQYELRVRGNCGESVFDVRRKLIFSAGRLEIQIVKPKLWWPRGYGEPYLYDINTELLLDGKVVQTRKDRIGIRTVELIRTEITTQDRPGNFLFKINNEPILCKGSNWVPVDIFHSIDAKKYDEIIELFCDINCNIIRCWGGNVYEDHALFELCDRHGLMVWQDFAMACAAYPQDMDFMEEIRQEAVSVVKKLRNHASIVLWSGDNECDFVREKRGLNCSDNKITRSILPDVIKQYDPYRPYLESSPYYSPEVVQRKDLSLMPEDHVWGPRDYYKSSFYRESKAHFISETGYHGCPSVTSIHQFIDEAFWWPWQNNPQWALHATDCLGLEGPFAYRIKLMADQIREFFGYDPSTLEEFAIASQISQAEGVKFMIERVRMKKWRTTGIIWWNMIDGWPQFSDAVVDYYGLKKLAYYYIRGVQQPFCIMVDEPDSWHVNVVAGNDSNEVKIGVYRIWDADTDETLMEGEFSCEANSNLLLGKIRISWSDKRLFLIEWTIEGRRYGNHYLLGFPPFSYGQYIQWMKQISDLPDGFTVETIGK